MVYLIRVILAFIIFNLLLGCGENISETKQSETKQSEIKKSVDSINKKEVSLESKKAYDPKLEVKDKLKELHLYVEEEFKSRFKDPDSMKIKNRVYSSKIKEIIDLEKVKKQGALFYYCFSYNAKNGLGGYTGYKTVSLDLIFLKDDIVNEVTQSALDFSIDSLHFGTLDLYKLSGSDFKIKCEIEEKASSTEELASDIYKNFIQ